MCNRNSNIHDANDNANTFFLRYIEYKHNPNSILAKRVCIEMQAFFF